MFTIKQETIMVNSGKEQLTIVLSGVVYDSIDLGELFSQLQAAFPKDDRETVQGITISDACEQLRNTLIKLVANHTILQGD